MNIILFDASLHSHLLPLTFTRPVSELCVGILTLREKWEKYLPGDYSWKTEEYLSGKFPMKMESENLVINGAVCASKKLAEAVGRLKAGQTLVKDGVILAQRISGDVTGWQEESEQLSYDENINLIDRLWKIFSLNGEEMENDFELLTKGRKSAKVSKTNTVLGDRIFLEEGAKAECAIINTTTGPVYLGKDSEVMEGCLIRGGLALGEHSQLKLGAKIYGTTTIGPWSKVGGEVNNSVILGYANKGHDGFLGNAVVGEWCNIGADSNNSNLKNNYDEIRLWSYVKKGFEKTGLQFCGLIMGDHSKCGINTMFNTGTVTGVMCNIYGSGFPRTFIPSYSWGGAAGYSVYNFDKALDTARRVMERRGMSPGEEDVAILKHIFEQTASFR